MKNEATKLKPALWDAANRRVTHWYSVEQGTM
jgi:hypothetical protein